MTPPTYTIKPITDLKVGDCFMPIPNTQTFGPCIKVSSLVEDGWNFEVKGVVIALPPKKLQTSLGAILTRPTSYDMDGVIVKLGEEIQLDVPRDTRVATPNPILGTLIRKTIEHNICKDGKILVSYTCKDLPPEWRNHFYQAIMENMAQKCIHLSDVEKLPTSISGIVNTIPGHPLHHDSSIPFQPLPALFIKSSIQEMEEKNAIETIAKFSHSKNQIQKVDGEWMVNIQPKGKNITEKLENIRSLQAALAEKFLQLEPQDEEEIIDKDGHFHGFICRHPDTFEKVKKLWEGKELEIHL